jgi:hypothetical protein
VAGKAGAGRQTGLRGTAGCRRPCAPLSRWAGGLSRALNGSNDGWVGGAAGRFGPRILDWGACVPPIQDAWTRGPPTPLRRVAAVAIALPSDYRRRSRPTTAQPATSATPAEPRTSGGRASLPPTGPARPPAHEPNALRGPARALRRRRLLQRANESKRPALAAALLTTLIFASVLAVVKSRGHIPGGRTPGVQRR